jgi:2C-methyl-D-erythritol 2,4-cyclodiphosphate synthase
VARRLKVGENRINIKATTTEKLGWVGQGKGMAATAVVLLCR